MTLSFNKNYITVFGVITCAIFVLIGYQNGIFSSPESLKVFLSDLGIFAPLGFILFQIIQCVILIIPGGFGCVIGVAVFGPVYGFIYNYISICMGSIINFLLARKYGKNLVLKLISQKIMINIFLELKRVINLISFLHLQCLLHVLRMIYYVF